MVHSRIQVEELEERGRSRFGVNETIFTLDRTFAPAAGSSKDDSDVRGLGSRGRLMRCKLNHIDSIGGVMGGVHLRTEQGMLSGLGRHVNQARRSGTSFQLRSFGFAQGSTTLYCPTATKPPVSSSN
jgi:hypothetical protein